MKIDINAKANSIKANKTGGWRTYIPKTDYKKCIGCGTCARVCPEIAIKMIKKNNKNIPKTDYDFCKGCGLCAEECPVKAIRMELDKK
jgi:2-oxoacid:acceptor oxidoreductase delta subunit (pyruvate/2-ketoisovalerate family)